MTFLYILNHILEAAGLYFYVFALYPHRHHRIKDILATVLCYTGLYFVYLRESILLNLFCMFLVYVFLLVFFIRRPFIDALLHVMINLIMIEISEQLVDLSFFLFKDNTSFVSTTKQYIIASVEVRVIHYTLIFAVVRILKRWHKLNVLTPKYKRITLAFTTITLVSLISLQTLGLSVSLDSSKILWLYILEATIISLSIGVIITLGLLSNHQADLLKLRSDMQREEDERNYNYLLKQQDTDQKILIHDIKNHLTSIHSLIKQEDYATATDQIEHLIQAPAITETVPVSNNQSLNLLLARYQTMARESHLEFSVDIKGVDLSFLTPDDITSLFCNLLDNAMDSAASSVDAHIHLRICTGPSPTSVHINLINTCNTEPEKGPDGEYITSKKDRLHHGFGLKSIERVTTKHHGVIETHYDKDENEFHTIILLFHTGENE